MSNETGSSSGSSELLLAEVTDEFLDRLNRGEQPDIEQYADRHPEIAAVIRQVFPALQVLRLPAADEAADGSKEKDDLTGRLGDYRIVREIGRGGMGIVYEAEQVSLSRRVALKVLPFAAVLDSKQLQRFKNEAQAAAHLHHNNIVPVFSVGSERGVHYYAMQFIEGETLAQVISELRQLAAPGNETRVGTGSSAVLDAFAPDRSTRSPAFFRSVAELGVQAAEALQHAHELGVVHRDIKPSNLLLDHRGRLWVTDFGLARLESSPDLTMTGDLLGTLRYMSPEQALGKPLGIDQRTDIYSLGVTLYELLTLRPALDAADRQTLLRSIAEDDPCPPRRINDAIAPDLETIVLKATAKEPSGRYASAIELAADLRRFLEHKPIKAKRPTLVEHVAKWSRRHRPLVAFAVLLLVMVVIGLSISTALIARERAEVMRQRDEAEAQRRRAELNFQKARDAVDQMLSEVGHTDLADVPLMEPVRKALLERALGFYQEFLKEQGDDPALIFDAALAYKRVADIHGLLGSNDQSEEHYKQAATLFDRSAGQIEQLPDQRERLAETLTHIAKIRMTLHQDEQAEQTYNRALAVWEALAEDAPAKPDFAQSVAARHYDLATLKARTARTDEALTEYRAALRLYRKLTAEFPAEPDYAFEMAFCHNNMANALGGVGRNAEALEALHIAIDGLGKLTARYPDKDTYRIELSRSQFNQGYVLQRVERYEEAEEALRASIEVRERLATDFPHRPMYRQKHANSLNRLAILLRDTDRPAQAEQTHRRVLKVQQELVEQFPGVSEFEHMLGGTLHNLALLIVDRSDAAGEQVEAIPLLERAIDHQNRAIEINSHEPWFRMFLRNHYDLLFDVLEARGEFEQAEQAVRRGLEIARKLTADFPDKVKFRELAGASSYNLGNRLRKSQRYDEAETAYREALEVYNLLSQVAPDVAWYQQGAAMTQQNLGVALEKSGDHDQAEQAYRGALALRKALVSEAPQRTSYRQSLARSHQSLAGLLASTGRPAEAVQQWSEGVEDCPQDAALHENFAWFLSTCADLQFRDANQAVELGRSAVELEPQRGANHNTLGIALHRAGDHPGAVAAIEKAVELRGDESNAWEWFLPGHDSLATRRERSGARMVRTRRGLHGKTRAGFR
ncbi:MAG: protein kinase [Planctomycetes bacterium]|nr:protein kinase [Planctomycetota bacterium]